MYSSFKPPYYKKHYFFQDLKEKKWFRLETTALKKE